MVVHEACDIDNKTTTESQSLRKSNLCILLNSPGSGKNKLFDNLGQIDLQLEI